jgi:hypothetical protein
MHQGDWTRNKNETLDKTSHRGTLEMGLRPLLPWHSDLGNDDGTLQQAWDRHPEFLASRWCEGWLSGRRRLVQRVDGSCVFLLLTDAAGFTRSSGGKPLVCRLFRYSVRWTTAI